MNKNIRRMEIWMADFKDSENQSIMKGEHPCIVISGWKTNIRKTGMVNVIPVTSNLIKYLNDVHIDLEGYSLKEHSKALCNKVCPIDKELLKFKIGEINDIYTQLEIEKAILIQFQMDNQRLEIEDNKQLEDYFINNIKNEKDKTICNELKTKISNLAVENKIEECIIACNKLIEIAINSNIEIKHKYLWHGYYHRALMHVRLEHYEIATDDARKSLEYVGEIRNGLNNFYSYSMWILAKAYENLNNIDRSLQIYSALSKYYKKEARINLRAGILCNIAKLNNNSKRISSLIKIIEKLDYTERQTDKSKQVLLDNMRNDLKSLI